MVDISSEWDSPVRLVTIEDEIASMLIGSSSVSKKRRTRTSTRAVEEVAQTGPSSSGVMESTNHVGVSAEDIPGYIPHCRPDA